jgi:alpha-beta hydrolase superfamily lysophospholipase
MTFKDITIAAKDGLKLYMCSWRPEDAVQGVVCLVHGIGEHCGRYEHLAKFLNEAGYELLSFDIRGHGKSQGQRGHIPDMDAIMHDIDLLVAEAVRTNPRKPIFLYGHSLGGILVLNYALSRLPEITGVIATGPALRLAYTPPAIKVSLGNIMNKIFPSYSQASGLNIQGLSHDPGVEKAYKEDPLVHDRISARLFCCIMETGEWVLENAARFPLPVLLMHGGEDMLASPDATRQFAKKVGEKSTLKIWDGLYHEIHNESQNQEIFAFLVAWMKKTADARLNEVRPSSER